jgi:translation initiation factor 2B subunit (eIF-2B alpha/beta/delta family)
MDDLALAISKIASDRESGASEILERAIDVLRRVMSRPTSIRLEVARALCRAQPGMAPIWNAALAATGDEGQPTRFERFVQRTERAPAALSRVTCELFVGSDPLSLVTLSSSASVRRAVRALVGQVSVRVACAEGRPALEGRQLAGALSEGGVAVTFFSDAGIGEALNGADDVIVGADAVASDWVINKVGTRMLAAAAALVGVPVYVIASRDKFCAPALAPFIAPRDGASGEIWDAPPPGVLVRNPYFERVPMNLVTAIITDGGVMPEPSVKAFCESLAPDAPAALVEQLARP